MAKYLSPEWLEEFRTLAEDQPTRPGATVNIQYKVTGGPEGEVDYYWVIEEGKIVDAKIGIIEPADFTMTQTYSDAAEIQRGELDPTAAFMQGRIKVTGSMTKMMSLLPITNSPEWKSLQEKVSAATEY